MKTTRLLAALALTCVGATGCNCAGKTNQRFPVLQLPADDGTGTERTQLDFGSVQVNAKSLRKIQVHNDGNVALVINTATTATPFGVTTALPLTVDVGAFADLEISFTPTEPDQRISGMLALTANDPARPSAQLALFGTGVLAVAKLVPNPIAFGDVYLGESKKVTVTLSNAGSDNLTASAVAFNGSTPASVTGDLSKLKVALGAGTTAQTELSYAPTMAEALMGASLELTFDAMSGGSLSVPITGRATFALPKLCFLRDGTGTELCADITTNSVQLPVGSFCDNRLSACADGGFSGKITIRNEGNIPVAYSAQWDSLPYGSARCDGGSVGSDFTFSNAPTAADGGKQTKFSDATVKLPPNANDPMPWATAPVTLTYRATSVCREDAADQARVLWTRQGEPAGTSRMPGSLFLTLSAASQLPRAVSSDWSCGTSSSPATVPCTAAFFGVNNAGDAPLKIAKVELWEEFPSGDAGFDAGGPNGGYFQICVPGNPGSPCNAFAWAGVDGGDPNQYAPHTLNAATNPAVPTQKQLGTLTFGPAGRGCVDAGAACPNTPYRIYAVVTTDDPYGGVVISKISGFGQ